MKKRLRFLISWLFLSACTTVSPSISTKPDWIDNPGKGVSASAAMHIRGRVAQENLAILRAREEYAKRFGVTIQSTQTQATTIANDRVSTVGLQVAQEDTNHKDIRAMVKAKWYDMEKDVIWIWLVPTDQ